MDITPNTRQLIINTSLINSKTDDAFFEQIKAINTALHIFSKKHMSEIIGFMDRSEAKGAQAKIYEVNGMQANTIELLVLDVSRRLLLTITNKDTKDVVSLVFYKGEFQQIEIKADPNNYPTEEDKWGLAHTALKMLLVLTNQESFSFMVRNDMKVLTYKKTTV